VPALVPARVRARRRAPAAGVRRRPALRRRGRGRVRWALTSWVQPQRAPGRAQAPAPGRPGAARPAASCPADTTRRPRRSTLGRAVRSCTRSSRRAAPAPVTGHRPRASCRAASTRRSRTPSRALAARSCIPWLPAAPRRAPRAARTRVRHWVASSPAGTSRRSRRSIPAPASRSCTPWRRAPRAAARAPSRRGSASPAAASRPPRRPSQGLAARSCIPPAPRAPRRTPWVARPDRGARRWRSRTIRRQTVEP
jgi:hypothetical protein